MPVAFIVTAGLERADNKAVHGKTHGGYRALFI
jgi:hypothetical protein